MPVKQQEKWIRSPFFKKHYGTVFGLTKMGKLYRLDIGNEKVKFSEDEISNVSDCQIIFDEDSFEALYDLFKYMKRKVKNDEEGRKESK